MEAVINRPYAGASDLERVIDLLETCRAVEAIDPWPPVYEVRQHLRATGGSRSADTRIWESRTGALAAFATIWDGVALVSCVHPYAQCDDLAQQILGWGLEQARNLGRICGERATLFVPICADDLNGGALLERHGFMPEDWSLLRMARRLDEPVPPPGVPAGFILRPVASEQELAAAVAMHQEVFIAGSTIVRDRLALIHAAGDVLALDLVAVAPDGALAAFCLCSSSRADGGHPGRRTGWIDLLGTRPAYRRHGLGRAILLAGLHQLKDRGAEIALLGTTSWNSVAQRLFASVGFQLLHHVRWYAWEE